MKMTNLGRFRLIVPAANAKPSPSIGQTLGPLGEFSSLFQDLFCMAVRFKADGVWYAAEQVIS